MNKIKKIEISLLVYMLITGIWIFLFKDRLTNIYGHIYFRFIFIAFLFIFIYFNNSIKDNRLFNAIRLFYPIFLLGYIYGETAYLNHIFFHHNLDKYFMAIDQKIFGFQPALLFSKVAPQKWIGELLNFAYFSFLWFPISVSILFFIYRRELAEYVIFTIVTSFLIYYLIFIILPVVGPQFYWDRSIAGSQISGFFSKAVKFSQKLGEHPTGAFPSSHVGMSFIITYLSYKYFRRLFYFLLPIALLIPFATIYIKAHYAIDVIGGFISVYFILALSNLLWHSFSILKENNFWVYSKIRKQIIAVIAKYF